MTVSRGRDFLALPGPTTVPHEVLQAMQRPAVDIYGEELTAVTDSCLDDLRRVFRTEQGRNLHLHRQRPRRLGGGALQRSLAR